METQTWTRLWLDYHKVYEENKSYKIELLGFSEKDRVIANALSEFKTGISGLICDRVLPSSDTDDKGDARILKIVMKDSVPSQGYSIQGSSEGILLEASDANGVLYGIFAILRGIACGKRTEELRMDAAPSNPLRMMNHWDNMDGSFLLQ